MPTSLAITHSSNLFSNSLVATSLCLLGSVCFCLPSSIHRRVAVSSLLSAASKSRFHTAPSTTSSDSTTRQLLDKFQSRPSINVNAKCSSPSHSSTVAEESILKYNKDKYKGVIIDSTALPVDVAEFIYKLKYSLDHWKNIGRRGVWLKIPLQKSHFIAPAVEIGFVFHHAEKEYLMLNYWLSTEENRMPPNASHQVGVGSVVLCEQDGKKKLLLVQEKSGPLRGSGIWKLPTGLVEQGEDIATAAEREVLEETGVAARFVGVLCFRHAHGDESPNLADLLHLPQYIHTYILTYMFLTSYYIQTPSSASPTSSSSAFCSPGDHQSVSHPSHIEPN